MIFAVQLFLAFFNEIEVDYEARINNCQLAAQAGPGSLIPHSSYFYLWLSRLSNL